MKKRLLAVLLLTVFIITNFNFVQALAYTKPEYFNDIRIGITNRRGSNEIGIKLEGNYIVDNQVIPSGSTFVLSKNGTKVRFNGKDYDELIFTPQASNNKLYISNSYSSGSYVDYYDFISKVSFKIVSDYILPVNIINMEDYLKGVVGHEMYPSYNIEALKAQAIAARTYALYNIGKHSGSGYDICDTTHCQVFYGLDTDNNYASYANVRKAVDETAGQILTYQGKLAPTYYSASNGGYTEATENVWTSSIAYLTARKDEYDGRENVQWSYRISLQNIEYILKKKGIIAQTDKFVSLDINHIDNYSSGRVSKIGIFYKDSLGTLQSLDITNKTAAAYGTPRTFLNYSDSTVSFSLKSALYTVTYDSAKGEYVFSGKGNGHGVGLSQIGANNRANAGQNYRQILNFYHLDSSGNSVIAISDILPKFTGISGYKNKVFMDETISLSASAQNGSGNGYLYKYVITKNGQTIYSKDFSNDSNLSYKPSERGIYEIKAYVKDPLSKNEYDDIRTLSVEAVRMVRISGKDRFDTGVEVSKDGWSEGSSAVVLASGNSFADALSATPLAKKYNAPILLTDTSAMSASVEGEIKRLGAKTAFIAGGTGVISTNIENKLKSLGINVIRLGGVDRFDTSVRIAKFLGDSSEIVVASGMGFADAVSIAPIAAIKNMPIILTDTSAVPASVDAYFKLKASSIKKTYIIGGDGVVGKYAMTKFPYAERIAGADRFETNYNIITRFINDISFTNVIVASGLNYPDALTGSALGAKTNGTVVLIDNIDKTMFPKTQSLINSKLDLINKIKLLGGEPVTPSEAVAGIK